MLQICSNFNILLLFLKIIIYYSIVYMFDWWCLMPLSTIFQLYRLFFVSSLSQKYICLCYLAQSRILIEHDGWTCRWWMGPRKYCLYGCFLVLLQIICVIFMNINDFSIVYSCFLCSVACTECRGNTCSCMRRSGLWFRWIVDA